MRKQTAGAAAAGRKRARGPKLAWSVAAIALVAVAAVAAAMSIGASPSGPAAVNVNVNVNVVRTAGDSLIARHRAMPAGGWAWQSSIQAPNYQTDRDVGAAGIGEGLLAAYAVTHDARYRSAAVAAGDFLLGVAEPAGGGSRWPDWADPDGTRSPTRFTSFDDGAAGISDFLWQLFQVSGARRFRTAALAGMRWLISRANGPSCPQAACWWTWTDDPSWTDQYYGVGMGDAGIVLAFDAFADRTGNRTFLSYARAGAAWLRRLTANGTRPPPAGSRDPAVQTGFLSGSAGIAYMFLERYAHDHNPADLTTARRLLGWVNDQAVADRAGGLRWPVQAGDDSSASGFELGVAGIAWVNLQAALQTGDPAYRETARRAGIWLREVRSPGGEWNESPGDATSPVHVGLDSGTAGIGWVLNDLARAGIDQTANRNAAHAALAAVYAEARHDQLGAYWYENRAGSRRQFPAEPSWHWGSAGIAAFAARLDGWSGLGPGGERAARP